MTYIVCSHFGLIYNSNLGLIYTCITDHYSSSNGTFFLDNIETMTIITKTISKIKNTWQCRLRSLLDGQQRNQTQQVWCISSIGRLGNQPGSILESQHVTLKPSLTEYINLRRFALWSLLLDSCSTVVALVLPFVVLLPLLPLPLVALVLPPNHFSRWILHTGLLLLRIIKGKGKFIYVHFFDRWGSLFVKIKTSLYSQLDVLIKDLRQYYI